MLSVNTSYAEPPSQTTTLIRGAAFAVTTVALVNLMNRRPILYRPGSYLPAILYGLGIAYGLDYFTWKQYHKVKAVRSPENQRLLMQQEEQRLTQLLALTRERLAAGTVAFEALSVPSDERISVPAFGFR